MSGTRDDLAWHDRYHDPASSLVVGFALAQVSADSGAELPVIHVLREQQGIGAGQAFMDVVIDAFCRWGSQKHVCT